MYLSLLFLPILSGVVSGLFGRKIGVKGTHLLACGFLLLATLLAIVCFYEVVISASPVEVFITNWFSSELFKVEWIFYFDSLSITMITIVLIVSTAVHVYSGALFNIYMSTFSRRIRYYIQRPVKQQTYPPTKDSGECSMFVKLRKSDPNLKISLSKLCLYGLIYRVQRAKHALKIRLGWTLTLKLIVWAECIIKGYIQSEIIHYYRTAKTYVRYTILCKWNWGFPKGPKSYGNGTGVVVNPTTYAIKKYGVNHKVQKRNYCFFLFYWSKIKNQNLCCNHLWWKFPRTNISFWLVITNAWMPMTLWWV